MLRKKRLTPPDKLWRWLTWQLTSWVQRPTRSGPHVQQVVKMSVMRLVVWSASGSVHSYPAKSENSCSTTRGCAMRSAGSYSIADRFARTTETDKSYEHSAAERSAKVPPPASVTLAPRRNLPSGRRSASAGWFAEGGRV